MCSGGATDPCFFGGFSLLLFTELSVSKGRTWAIAVLTGSVQGPLPPETSRSSLGKKARSVLMFFWACQDSQQITSFCYGPSFVASKCGRADQGHTSPVSRSLPTLLRKLHLIPTTLTHNSPCSAPWEPMETQHVSRRVWTTPVSYNTGYPK